MKEKANVNFSMSMYIEIGKQSSVKMVCFLHFFCEVRAMQRAFPILVRARARTDYSTVVPQSNLQ
ncbi:hypothetical protein GT3921_17270 [Geobacillus thermocatenulatus]|nr:hypothetical protein GT3921_17270 [Geobacillus thermocatenulatus]